MAKPKSPLLSLGAKGTIGDALTYQDRGRGTIARAKPIPANPRSLAQTYQRWLYEDYCYLWGKQSQATKDTYRTDGSRFHLTAFQYWMRVQLSLLPDIAGWWKMDDNRGAITRDSSRNKNTAIVIGASPVPGHIDGCFYFDGINDQLRAPHSPSLDITGDLTIDCLINLDAMVAGPFIKTIVSKGNYLQSYLFCYYRVPSQLEARISNFAVAVYPIATDAIWHSAIFVYIAGTGGRIYLDGVPGALGVNVGAIPSVNAPLFIGDERTPTADRDLHGSIDNLIIYNRALDATEALRHSERRYPL